MKEITYSIVVPVYGKASQVAALVEQCRQVMSPLGSFEILLVDDASPHTSTWPALVEVAKSLDEVSAYRLMRNTNKTGAILCGIAQAKGDFIILMDDDLQHDPHDIPALLAALEHHIVIAHLHYKQQSLVRQWMSMCKGKLDEWLVGKPRGIHFSPFMLLHRSVAVGMLAVKTTYPYLPALLFGASHDVVNVPVRHRPRADGQSGFTLWRMLRLVSNLVLNNSSILLRGMSFIGLTAFLISMVLATYYIWKKVWVGIPIAGWTSLMVVVLLLGGLILLSFGIVGEYLIRMIRLQEGRPPYLIADRVG